MTRVEEMRVDSFGRERGSGRTGRASIIEEMRVDFKTCQIFQVEDRPEALSDLLHLVDELFLLPPLSTLLVTLVVTGAAIRSPYPRHYYSFSTAPPPSVVPPPLPSDFLPSPDLVFLSVLLQLKVSMR
ncbi:hypothetical protein Sjap_003178 [Stephania japonica]|uniref:Uncharacterized protein n=1 Tax=Stephania japonica TaxID=461633 RepID=A0AAP0KN91_9MAGN